MFEYSVIREIFPHNKENIAMEELKAILRKNMSTNEVYSALFQFNLSQEELMAAVTLTQALSEGNHIEFEAVLPQWYYGSRANWEDIQWQPGVGATGSVGTFKLVEHAFYTLAVATCGWKKEYKVVISCKHRKILTPCVCAGD